MAHPGPLHLRVRLGATQAGARPARSAVLTWPGKLERFLAALTLFLLAADMPSVWFRNLQDEVSGLAATGDSLTLVVFLTLYSLLLSRLLNNGALALSVMGRAPWLFVFLGWVTVSFLWSADPVFTFRRVLPLLLTTAFGLFLVIRFSLRDILAMSAVAFGAVTLLNYAFIFGIPASGVARSGWIGIHLNKNLMGRHEVLAAVVYLVGASVLTRWRIPLLLAFAAAVGLVIGSTSSTSMVGLLAVLGNFAVFRVFRARDTLFGAVTVSFISTAVLAAIVTFTQLEFLAGLLGKDTTFTGRTELWDLSLQAVWDRPFWGWGWDAYWRGYFSPAHEMWVKMPWKPPHAHNALLDYLLVIGFPGATIFLVMFVRGVVRSARFIRDTVGAIGLFPIMVMTYAFVFSLTEAGVVGRHERWVLTVVALLTVADASTRSAESINTDQSDNDDSTPEVTQRLAIESGLETSWSNPL